MSKTSEPRDVPQGMAVAFTFFVLSIFLYFESDYFGFLSRAVAIGCIAIGFIGFGIEMDRLIVKDSNIRENRQRWTGIFDNIGIAIALIIVWSVVYYYFSYIWVNVLTSCFLLFGAYGLLLGISHALIDLIIKQNKQQHLESNVNLQVTQPVQANSISFPSSTKIVVFIVGAVGFAASIIQILQFAKIL